jgi:hypothetical protein
MPMDRRIIFKWILKKRSADPVASSCEYGNESEFLGPMKGGDSGKVATVTESYLSPVLIRISCMKFK